MSFSGLILAGVNFLPIVIKERIPTAKTTKPKLVNSNIEKGVSIKRPDISLASKLVDDPIKVSVPPIIDAEDSDMRIFDGEVPFCLAKVITRGINTATTGVLF